MDSVAFIWRHFPQKILINLQDENYIFKFTAEPQNLIAVGGVEESQGDILRYLAAAIQNKKEPTIILLTFVTGGNIPDIKYCEHEMDWSEADVNQRQPNEWPTLWNVA